MKIPSQIRILKKRLIIKKPPLTTHNPKLHNINKLYPRKTQHETRQKKLQTI